MNDVEERERETTGKATWHSSHQSTGREESYAEWASSRFADGFTFIYSLPNVSRVLMSRVFACARGPPRVKVTLFLQHVLRNDYGHGENVTKRNDLGIDERRQTSFRLTDRVSSSLRAIPL